MIDYRAGNWGLHVAFGLRGSLVPKSLTMALPNALLTFLIATYLRAPGADDIDAGTITKFHDDTADAALAVISSFTVIMTFILYNRSRTSYNRWWEGGTLLQKTRGEWFNAYSSIMAFTSMKKEHQQEVQALTQLLARLMSLLMCCGLQQVSPNRDRPFEIIDLEGIEPESMEFLNSAPDKVEVILQWIQRSMVIHAQTGVLPVAPPILSRAFQEVSRGIVNLQNARKIADFPYPFPLAQISMILQIMHFCTLPFAVSLALPRAWATCFSFFTIFTLWCIHFNAVELEFPFGTRSNDLPMVEFQQDWNNSIVTLLNSRASQPPKFDYSPEFHNDITMAMSDASSLYVPGKSEEVAARRGVANIKISSRKRKSEVDHGGGGGSRSSSKEKVGSTDASQPTQIGMPEAHKSVEGCTKDATADSFPKVAKEIQDKLAQDLGKLGVEAHSSAQSSTARLPIRGSGDTQQNGGTGGPLLSGLAEPLSAGLGVCPSWFGGAASTRQRPSETNETATARQSSSSPFNVGSAVSQSCFGGGSKFYTPS